MLSVMHFGYNNNFSEKLLPQTINERENYEQCAHRLTANTVKVPIPV